MSNFVVKSFTPDDLRSRMNGNERRITAANLSSVYEEALAFKGGEPSLSNADVLTILRIVLTSKVTEILLRYHRDKTMQVAHQIVFFFLHSGDVENVDLQLTLLGNIIGQSLKDRVEVKVSRFHAGEILIVDLDLPAEFRLELRKQVFDKQLLDAPHLMIIRSV